jgi:hypothetical protein
MVIGIHQPEHFPYLGFFQKMSKCDVFVILDNVKFKKNNFQNRNKYLNTHTDEGEWFTIPVSKKSNGMLINEIKVEDGVWRKKIKKQLSQRFPKHDIGNIYDYDNLLDINMDSIEYCAHHLGIDNVDICYSSDLEVDGSKTELLYNICKELKGTKYISGQGGIDYLDTDNYFKDIELEIFKPEVSDYFTTLQHI